MTLAERFARLHKEALALQVLFAQLQKKVKLAHKVQYNQNWDIVRSIADLEPF